MKKVALFSGQGSQYVGMLKDYYENNIESKNLIDKADELLGYSLSNICFNGPVEKLKETRYTQPAIFLHSAVVSSLTKEKLIIEGVAGHSVGEYAALYSAGVISFEDAVKLVSLRGELMFKAGENEPGTMFAIIGMEDEVLIDICKMLTIEGNVVVPANFNSPGQIVISGSRDYLREKSGIFKEKGARMVMELPVSGAFHSPLMKPAQDKLAEAINNIEFKNASVPVYTNVDAKEETNSEELKKKLIEQLTAPVLWTQILNNLHKAGFTDFVEMGPGNVLQGLTKRTLKDINISGFDKLQDIENV
ncbi:MAG: [acyl-carrier-protein] S-malonyltransferase [Ignavibacteriae bacterium HGW-Ignavibacteriae-4]|jgi:[acyl-carrier-protein] S-malonyltransferase|nr:MAG: [acyl-carrier-protein] S-malonyltransferase [Ignavibacteriae bacterium HGW-Ignavibacteriae-4]